MIIDAWPYFNEKLVASIHLDENSSWIDQSHVVEANRTFRYKEKPFNFEAGLWPRVHYHPIDVNDLFKKPAWRLRKRPFFLIKSDFAWHNEAVQRNLTSSLLEINEKDVLIFSDVDEIINRSVAERIIDGVHRHGLITMKMHLTHYYFDLFVDGWGGPPDYSYRVFAMTGKHFRQLGITVDQLRKLGEAGRLLNEVHCLDEFAGFHHSWIGGIESVVTKLGAYAHGSEDHDPDLYLPNGAINPTTVMEHIQNGRPLHGKHVSLVADGRCELLRSVQSIRATNESCFVH